MPNDLVSSTEARKILGGISPSTLTRLVKDEKITPALKGEGIRGPMWFRAEDVQTLAEQRAA